MASGGACMYMASSAQPVCLLVGAFNLFTFKLIIEMYDPIAIFLIVLGLFPAGFFLLLCFLLKEVPFSSVVKLVLWC